MLVALPVILELKVPLVIPARMELVVQEAQPERKEITELKVPAVTLAIMELEVLVELPAALVQKVLKVRVVTLAIMEPAAPVEQPAQKEIMVLRVMPALEEEAVVVAAADVEAFVVDVLVVRVVLLVVGQTV